MASSSERIRPNARAKAAALREKERRREARRRMLIALGAVVAVLAVITTLIVIKLSKDDSPAPVAAVSLDPATAAKVTTLPTATFDAIGRGTVKELPKPITGAALTKDGKPKVVYIGAEYCPYCAAERWPVVAALARFGTWRNLAATTSGAKPEVYPNTPTFSFHGAGYTSPYLAFEAVETESNKRQGNGYAPLEKMTSEQQQLLAKYQPGGGIPFLTFGNRFMIGGASYDPGVLSGKSLTQIADDLTKPSTAVAKGIGGTANAMTAVICTLTKNQPSKVCDSTAVKALRGQLGGG